MRMLGPRPIGDAAELATVVAECVPHLEAGLRLLDRPATAGDVTVELAGIDAHGRLALILCDVVAGPETVLRALEAQAWWREHAAHAARVFADPALDAAAAPRALVVATRWSDRALRVLRALGPLAPTAVEGRVFRDADGAAVVSLDRLDVREEARGPAAADASARNDTRPAPALADGPVASPTPGEADGRRAAVLIERLERLRFSEVFR